MDSTFNAHSRGPIGSEKGTMNLIHILILQRASIMRLLVLVAVLVAVAACTTASTRDDIPPFRQGVVTVRQQSSSAFAEVNRFLREQQIERAMRQAALNEDLFIEALDTADLSKWDRAYAQIESYAAKVERLLSSDQRAGVEGEISALGQKIQGLSNDQLPATVTVAFETFGGFLIQMKTEKDARQAMRTADPSVQAVFNAMMDAIGADRDSGVRGTVGASWTQILARIDVREFRTAANEDAKLSGIHRYLEALDERDSQDRLLASIRLSLATLAKTHQELAEGHAVTAGALIQVIQDEYKAYREQLEAARLRKAAGKTTEASP